MKMIGRIVMNSKMNVNATGSDQKVVSKELCGGCHSFDGFSCDLSPIASDASVVCPYAINNHDRTNVYSYNNKGQPQRHRADSRKDLVDDS